MRVNTRRQRELHEDAVHVLGVHLLGGDVARYRHGDQHALGIVTDRRHEQRRMREAGYLH